MGAFLGDNTFLVGISIDGPKGLHDTYRVNKAGRGSYDQAGRAVKNAPRNGPVSLFA